MKPSFSFTILSVLLIGALLPGTFLTGCGGRGEDLRDRNSVSDIRQGARTTDESQMSGTISDEELKVCGDKFIEEVTASPGETITSYIDAQRCVTIFESSSDSFDFENNVELRKLRKGLQDMLSDKSVLIDRFNQQLNGCEFCYVGPKRTSNKAYAVVRIEQAAGGVNYYLLSCRKTEEGHVEGYEIYMPMTGLTFEETFALSMVETAKGMPSVLKTLNPIKRKQMQDMLSAKSKMTNANLDGDYQTVISTYESAHLQESNSQMLDFIYLGALGSAYINTENPAERKDLESRMTSTVALLKKRDPQFIGGDFQLLDLFFLKREMEKFDAAIEAITDAIGEDPYWHFYRGALYVESDPAKALEYYNQALEAGLVSRTFFICYNTLLKIIPETTDQQYEDFYKIVEQNYGDDFANLLREAE